MVFLQHSAGVMLIACAIYIFIAAICRMILSFSAANDSDDLAQGNAELQEENEQLTEELSDLSNQYAAVLECALEMKAELASLKGVDTDINDVANELEREAGLCGEEGCNGACQAGG